jgi:hypothetical protein
MTPPGNRSFFAQRHWLWWFMLLVFVLVIGARLRLLGFPLERDEGEYAYAGQLILQGLPPYDLAYNMKFPGTYLAYAGIMAVFGQTPVGIHLGMLFLTTATALMLFWLGKKILDEAAGIVTATTYMVLAASPSMLGLTGHATHFCAFFATAGLCLMWRARQKESFGLIAAFALCFGTAVLMKQHASIIAAWAGLAFACGKLCDRSAPIGKRLVAVLFCAVMMLLPFGLCCLWLWHAGVFDKFWFWTIRYAKEYATGVPLSYAGQFFWHTFRFIVVKGILLWVIALAGLVVIWFDGRWKNQRVWALGFCVASALAVCPDLYFRKHYFLIALPALALLAGATISGLRKIWSDRNPGAPANDWPALVFALAVAVSIFSFRDIWFQDSMNEIVRGANDAEHGLYGADPLPESEMVAKYIAANSAPDARVAILGSEPEIYFLAHRHSATGYIYTYAEMEPQPFALTMQHEMIGNIVSNRPEFVVFADNIMSWNRRPDSDPTIFNWWDSYKTNYTLVGMADVISRTNTIYVFGTNYIAHYPEAHGSALEIFQRK